MRTLIRRPRHVFGAAAAVAALVGVLLVTTTPAFAEDPAPLSLCVKKLNGQLRMSSSCDANETPVDVITSEVFDPQTLLLAALRESYLESVEDMKAMAAKIEFLNQQKAAIRSQLDAVELRLVDVELIAARVDTDDDGFPDVDDNCPTAWGVPPDGCPVH